VLRAMNDPCLAIIIPGDALTEDTAIDFVSVTYVGITPRSPEVVHMAKH